MNSRQWDIFTKFRDEFKDYCNNMNNAFSAVLTPLQTAVCKDDTPPYPVQTSVVYNSSLDDITPESTIRLIVIGDNPGKDEQLAKNRRYLVGQSGKIADRFFRLHPEFNINFRENVIILNKTPVHTAKTKHLKTLYKTGGASIKNLLMNSQLWMAEKTAALHQSLCAAASKEDETCELWLVGYAELKGRGIFIPYKNRLKELYEDNPYWSKVLTFQHFSMNRFSIDLDGFMKKNAELSSKEAVRRLGENHSADIFQSE